MLSSRRELSRLFKLNIAPGANYLVETDPRFANYRNFLSSDYFEKQLQLDPERNLKRYGDGFVEQQLVNDQILALIAARQVLIDAAHDTSLGSDHSSYSKTAVGGSV